MPTPLQRDGANSLHGWEHIFIITCIPVLILERLSSTSVELSEWTPRCFSSYSNETVYGSFSFGGQVGRTRAKN